MKFYSTNNKDHKVSLRDAVVQGLAPDNGLYMPEAIPALPEKFFDELRGKSFPQIAFEVAKNMIGEDIPEADLRRIVNHTIQFDAPLVEVEKDVYALELFHGPTLAFKDFGARFMSQMLGYFARQQQQEIIILVATSGDTGSAVANGFLGVEGTRVVVLYPSGKVSDLQEKQFTTLGQNITALEVDGTFDDCQRLVKQAFSDQTLREELFLTSANSINIARLLPQSFYYFCAYARRPGKEEVVFSVPSGNFGNLTAGLIAKRMGLPVKHFVASTNVNDVVPEYLKTGVFAARPSRQTISNAMDVGNPSNFYRMLDLYNNDLKSLQHDICGYAFTDNETRSVMRHVFERSKYMLDPHGAVAYQGLKRYFEETNEKNSTGIFLSTAHPAKFVDVVNTTLNTSMDIPPALLEFSKKQKQSIRMKSDYRSLKDLLMDL